MSRMKRALVMHAGDSVALALEDLPGGSMVQAGDQLVGLRQAIPFGHKVALVPIAAGAAVYKYGQPIGRATVDIGPGEHVHIHNLASTRGGSEPPTNDPSSSIGSLSLSLEAASQMPAVIRTGHQSVLSEAAQSIGTFLGYRRKDGRAGVRNHVLVLATVQCASVVVDRLGRALPDVVALSHPWGCSQLGADLAQTRLVLEEFAAHPNVGACLMIGLGCETMPTIEMADRLAARGVLVRRLTIQEEGGNRATMERGLSLARELLQETTCAHREPIPLSELVVGLECGGSDAWSGVTANPALGQASDLLVEAGATAILSEVPEFIGAEHLLAARAADAQVAAAIVGACGRYEAEARRMGADLRGAQPTPGNMTGGLTTIEEKSLGAIAKGGSTTVQEYLPYGHRPLRRGLVVMDTPGNDPESVTGMIAGGAQVVVFTTGRGTPTGCPIAPVIKVATNSAMYDRLHEDMDLNAGTVLDGSEALAQAGRRIFEMILAVAGGRTTASEAWGAREFAINIAGPRM